MNTDDLEVISFKKDRTGKLLEEDRWTVSALGGVVPGIGDYFTLLVPDEGILLQAVKGRYFVRDIYTETDERCFWMLVVEDTEPEDIFEIEDAIRADTKALGK